MKTDLFIKNIAAVIDLSETEIHQLLGFIEVRKMAKGDFLLQAGQVCNIIGFITRGTLIYYSLSENGKETTTDFAFEGDWVTDNRSRLNRAPSLINIKAIRDSELLLIRNEDLHRCYEQIPKLEKLGRILTEKAFIRIAEQSISLQTLSASQRYEKLITEYPEIFQKVPLYHIANYLGIAPKSLSRIRKG